MPYRFTAEDGSVEQAVRRIAVEQIESALGEIADGELDRHETVHQVRKRCKKLRGLVRLVRPAFDGYKEENARFRDAARTLSHVRDAQSIIETLDDLVEAFGDAVGEDAFRSVRAELIARREHSAEDEAGIDDRLAEFADVMRAARHDAKEWSLKAEGWDAVEGGLLKTYGRACKAMSRALDEPSTERLHEWRKRVKYHWYHSRLLREIWPGPMKAHRDAADELANDLGDDHDLAILHRTVSGDGDRFGETSTIRALTGLIGRRRCELQHKARLIGQRLFAEKPPQIGRRWRACWTTWQAAQETPIVQVDGIHSGASDADPIACGT